MLKSNWKHIISDTPCPDIHSLELYHKGLLNAAQRFEIENHLLSCEACSDVIEGLFILDDSEKLNIIEKELKMKLSEMLSKKEKRQKVIIFYRRISVAATILIILGISFFVNRFNISERKMTSSISKEETRAVDKKDSILTTKIDTKKIAVVQEMKKGYTPIPATKKEISSNLETETNENIEIVANDAVMGESSNIEPPISFEEKAPVSLAKSDGSSKSKSLLAKAPAKKASPEIRYSDGKIVGHVFDQSGYPLPGATVNVKGFSVGTITDLNGEFILDTVYSDKKINISYVGYLTKEIKLDPDSVSKIVLQENLLALDEVVVVGYGTVKKRELTGAVSKVKENLITRALQGKVSGVTIVNKRKLTVEKDSLKKLDIKTVDWYIKKQLVEKYIQLEDGTNAMETLLELKNISLGTNLQEEIMVIYNLVKEEKFKKALKKAKELENR